MDNSDETGEDFILSDEEMKSEYQESKKYNPFVELGEPSSHFKNLGFWCGITLGKDPHKAFLELLERHFSLFGKRKNDLESLHAYDRNRFFERINEVTILIHSLNAKIADQANEIPELKVQIDKLGEEVVGLQKELDSSYQKLGEAKKTLIDNHIQATFEELRSLNDKYREISDKHGEMNAAAKARNPDAFDYKPSLLANLEESYTDFYSKVQEKATGIGLDGNWLTNPWYLQIFGLLTAYASGYFFSIFAGEQALDSGGITFFIITGLFKFLGGLVSLSPWIGYSIAALIIIVVPFIFLLISYVCRRLLDSHEMRRAKRGDDINVILDSDNKIQVAEIAKVDDFYSFFLKKIPFGLLVSLIFALVAFGYAGAADTTGATDALTGRLAGLAASLSGFVVGGNVSLGLAGLIYIYLIYVINPRLGNRFSPRPEGEAGGSVRSTVIVNLELLAVFIGMLAVVLLILFGLEKDFLFRNMPAVENRTAFVALVFFIITATITAFVFGYGMYFSGILETRDGVERRLLQLNRQRALSNFPSIKTAISADRMFGKQYLDIVKKLLNRIEQKADMASATRASSDQKKERSSKFYFFLPKAIRRLFEARKTDRDRLDEKLDELNVAANLPPEDEYYFPEITSEISGLDGQIKEKKKRLLIIDAEIRSRQEENSEYIRRLNASETKLQDRVREWKKHISFLNREQFKEVERFNRKYESEVSALSDGFNMALWFLESGGNPANLVGEDEPDERK